MMKHDPGVMQHCFELAAKGHGRVNPNPMVGAVLVQAGEVIATGHHKRYGGPHAERNCLRTAGQKAKGGTLYVNLEPCIHHGKTPPCVEAIVNAGVSNVVVAMKDPNPRVSGRGIAALRKAGISVSTGLLRSEAQKLNEKFVWWHTEGLPFVGIKWAQSLDGYVADSAGRSQWITGEGARRYAHYLRAGYDALLVGAGTVLKDDPRLTVRHVEGNDPVRVILDGKLRVSGTEKVFRQRKGRTIVLTAAKNIRGPRAAVRRMMAHGVEVLGLPGGMSISPHLALRILGSEGITSVLVEGGPTTIRRFYDAGMYNIYHVFVRSGLLGGGMPALPIARRTDLKGLRKTRGTDLLMFSDGDFLVEGGKAG